MYNSSIYNTAGVPRIDSYEQALYKVQHTKPINSEQSKGRIPLGSRRYHARASIRMLGTTVQLCEWRDSPFVEWFPDNSFVVHVPAYESAFQCADLDPFLPINMGLRWDKGRYVLAFRDSTNGPIKEYLLKNTMRFRPRPERGIYSFEHDLFDEHPVEYSLRLKPQAYRKFMTPYQSWLDWMEDVGAIDNKSSGPNNEEWRERSALAYQNLCTAIGIPSGKIFWDAVYAKAVKSRPQYGEEYKRLMDDYRRRNILPFGKTSRRGKKLEFHSLAVDTVLEWIADPSMRNWVDARYLAETAEFANDLIPPTFVKTMVLHKFREQLFVKQQLADGEIPSRTNEEYFNSFTFLTEKPLSQG
jgi:hypothetical protein